MHLKLYVCVYVWMNCFQTVYRLPAPILKIRSFLPPTPNKEPLMPFHCTSHEIKLRTQSYTHDLALIPLLEISRWHTKCQSHSGPLLGSLAPLNLPFGLPTRVFPQRFKLILFHHSDPTSIYKVSFPGLPGSICWLVSLLMVCLLPQECKPHEDHDSGCACLCSPRPSVPAREGC